MGHPKTSYDATTGTLDANPKYFDRHHGVELFSWGPWVKPGVNMQAGWTIAEVWWNGDAPPVHVLAPAGCNGVVKSVNHNVDDGLLHRDPPQWLLTLETS